MKRYTSFKEVDAAIITLIGEVNSQNGMVTLHLTDNTEGEIEHFAVSREWLAKHSDNGAKDLVGGYLVKYADGYTSWSPAEAFEEGYKEITNEGHAALQNEADGDFSFSIALDVLKEGHKVARRGWNGKDMHIEKQTPTDTSKMTLPYLFMKTAQGDLVPWLASQTDLLAEDWVIVE